MSRAVRAAERHHPPPANAPAPHGASFAGSSVTLEVHPVAHRGARMGAVVVRTNLNATVRGVKRLVARKLDASAKHLRLIVGGRDLGASEGDVLGACLVRQEGAGETIRAQALVNRVGEDEDAVEGVDADSDEAALARLPRVQLARQPGAHDVLLELAEVGGEETRALAREMLERCQRDSRGAGTTPGYPRARRPGGRVVAVSRVTLAIARADGVRVTGVGRSVIPKRRGRGGGGELASAPRILRGIRVRARGARRPSSRRRGEPGRLRRGGVAGILGGRVRVA